MSRVAALARHNVRETGVSGRFTSQANLREAQKKLLAPSSRWRKEWVKPGSSASSSVQASYKIRKWVKYDEGGENAEESEQPTEEQVTAAVTGAGELLEPANDAGTPAGSTPAAASSTILATVPGTTPAASSPAPPAAMTDSQTAPAVAEAKPAQPEAGTSQQSVTIQEEAPTDSSLQPGKDDKGGEMEVEQEQREHDVRLAPELVGKEAAETRAVLGISDPIEGGPPEVTT